MFDQLKEYIFKASEEKLRQQEEIEYVRDRVLAKFPLLGTTMARLKTAPAKVIDDETIDTAATDGRTVFYNPDWFMPLSDDEKVFVYAHEVMHVAFNHILRSGNRNHKIWNQATDAVINQILKSESLPMPENGVDIADAIQHSAEEMYEKLLRENKNNKNDKNEQAGHDNHNIWKKALERAEKEKQKQKNNNGASGDEKNEKQQNQDQGGTQNQAQKNQSETDKKNSPNDSESEKNFPQENQRTRAQRAAQAQRALSAAKNHAMNQAARDSVQNFGPVGESDAVVDWRRVLKKSLEEEHDKWSYRRSDEDNDFMARVEELDDEERADTEVMLDTSGSVSESFLREFLRQLKPLLKNGNLHAGCFDELFYGLNDIKTNDDIDNFKIISQTGGTRLDVPVKSFSKKPDINKIIFTDGYCSPHAMPDASTRNIKNLIWLVYGNRDFHPICGRVIQIDPTTIHNNFTMVPHAAIIDPSHHR